MKLTGNGWLRAAMRVGLCAVMVCALALPVQMAAAQAVSTTTVQGTVYLANGQPGAGTLVVSWPSFTTAAGQKVAADKITVTIPADGFVSVNLAPNQGATPAGEFYTAVFYMSDGTTNTEYWVIPAAAQASLAQVEAQVMPAAQAVQSVSKTYVDQAVAEALSNHIDVSGGNLTGPLYLSGDPTQPLQAADKHYVDQSVAQAVPLAGGSMTGGLTTPAINGVQAPAAGSAQTTLQAAVNAAGTNGAVEIPPTYAGTDTFTNANGVRVTDLRTSGAQQTARSVKEFGAVCDGVTDDTSALQAAIDYAHTHNVALTIPEGICKTHPLNWHGESIGGVSEQDSALMGFPGQDVLMTMPDSSTLMANTRIHDLTIYVDQSLDASCSPAEGRAAGGNCQYSRPIENNSIFSNGGNGQTDSTGTGAGWWVGNCAIAMPATTGAGGNGLRNATIENVKIVTTGTDPMAAQYPGAHSTHTCGIYLAQWPQRSEFRNIDIQGPNTGVAIPALPVATPAGLTADSNRWQNITIEAAHAFTAAAGSNNVLDNVAAVAGNSAATDEPPTGIVLDLPSGNQGWTVRNAVVQPIWDAVQPQLTVTTSSGAVTAVTVGSEHGLGFDPYGTQVPLAFSTGCTAQATASVNSDGSIGSVSVTQGGTGCSSTTTASVNEPGTWDTAAPVNLIGGQNISVFAGDLLKGNGGYTVWDASGSQSYGTQLAGGGGNLPGGGSYPGLVASTAAGSTYKVDQFPGADFGAKLQACLGAINPTYGGTCDARNFTGTLSMGSNLTISTANTAIDLPCATIATANQVIVTAGTRNVALHGCAMRGGSVASGSQGGTVFEYSGTGAMVQVGDTAYAVNTPGFHMDNAVINTTGAGSATAEGLVAYRTQELDLESLYFLGNANQTGMTLDGTGNYTGGTFFDDAFDGFGTAVNGVGHEISNTATTDWLNASTFVRLHIDCPTSNGNPIAGTIGINLQQGDGNTFTGGDVEGCATALHLGPNAQNNTIIGLRNENSTKQVVADAGSSYNDWITGGTMLPGQLTDNGTQNSFLDTFHRSFNGLNGDWYKSQQDATLTNHFRLGTGAGHERGLLNRYQTDYGYRWTTGLSDATAGEQFYEIEDELNNVYRLSIGQYNHGESSTNDQTVLNAAGTGAIVLNGSTNAGTGGVIFGSGGANASTVATIDNAGDAQFNGMLQVGGTSTFSGTTTVKNQADAEIDSTLWAGLTAPQKESFLYKDWNGDNQWYMMKDTSNNWALNSAIGGLDSFKAYQSNNSGDTYINASNATGHIRLNYESGSGAETDIYSGSSSNLDAAFSGPTSIRFPGLAASSGTDCLQIDNSGYISNTGSACGSGSGGTTGTINSGNSGQIAYYTANGTALSGMSMVPVSAGGTGASTAPAALANLLPGAAADGNNGLSIAGNVGASASITKTSPVADIRAYGGVGDGVSDTGPALRAAFAAIKNTGGTIYIPDGSWNFSSIDGTSGYVLDARNASNVHLKCAPGANITVASSISPGAFIAIGEYYGLEEVSGYTFNAIPDPGAVTLKLTTASDAGNFSVGQAIYIMGGPGTESQGDGEINWVTSVNATTGVIGLLKPTGKPFTGTGSSTLHVVPAPSNAFAYDLSVTGCHATLNNGDFVYLYESIHTLIADNNVTLPATASRGMMINSYYPLADLTVKNNRYVGGSSQIIQLADGWRDIVIEGNNFTSQSGQAVLNPSEGVENLTIAHNHLYQVIPSTGVSGNTATIMFSTAYNVTVNDNSIQLDNESSTAIDAIEMGLSNGHCTHCSVTGNVIQLSGPVSTNSTAISGSGGPASIVGNTIYTSGYGIQPNTGSTVTGNTIYLTGSTPKAGITIANDSVIVGNRIYGTGTAAGSGIGYPTSTGPAVVAGNMISDVQKAFNAASSNSILFANNVCDNVSNSTYCNELDWNGDTNLYRSAAGVLKTDGELDANILSAPTGNITTLNSTTVNATTGYKCNGMYGASGTYLESTGSGCTWGTVAGGLVPNVPAWLLWQGDGSGSALNCTSGTCYATGDNWYSSVTVASGATLAAHYYSGAPLSYATMPLIIRSTGTCTIAGTISVSPNTSGDGLTSNTFGGGSGGGGGGGTNAGSSGSAGNSGNGNGAAGAAGGGTGGNGNMGSFGGQLERGITSQGVSLSNFLNRAWGGAAGGAGGSSGGAGGAGGGVVILDCQTIDFTGTIDVSGAAGGDSTGNNIGAGGGGGGGFVIMRSQNLTNSGTINVSGGAGGSCGSYTGCGAGGAGADGWSEVFTH